MNSRINILSPELNINDKVIKNLWLSKPLSTIKEDCFNKINFQFNNPHCNWDKNINKRNTINFLHTQIQSENYYLKDPLIYQTNRSNNFHQSFENEYIEHLCRNNINYFKEQENCSSIISTKIEDDFDSIKPLGLSNKISNIFKNVINYIGSKNFEKENEVNFAESLSFNINLNDSFINAFDSYPEKAPVIFDYLNALNSFYSSVDYSKVANVAVILYYDEAEKTLKFSFLFKYHNRHTEAKNEFNFYLIFLLRDEYLNIPPPIYIFLLTLINFHQLNKVRYEYKGSNRYKKK